MWRRVNWMHEAVSKLMFWLGALALALIVPIYSYEVLMRYAFRAPTLWASDFVSFLLLITTFLVVPWLTREGGHVAVTILPDTLPAKLGKLVTRVGFLAGGTVCVWVAYISASDTISLYQRSSFTMTAIPMPRWILSACITYGIANCSVYFFKVALLDLKSEHGNTPC